MRFTSALPAIGACWLVSCSFPEYALEADRQLASVCTDGLPSDAETDIDCGGGCSPCAANQACGDGHDCISQSCRDGLCQPPACDDGVQNGAETDRDCGGQCARCETGRECFNNNDCLDGVCAPSACTGNVCPPGSCAAATCQDMTQNGDETGLDCGGSCAPCGPGLGCVEDNDCASNNCLGVCVSTSCTNGVIDGAETDVDCGGECGKCAAEMGCDSATDCASLVCESDGTCAASSCEDQVQNGDESDTDCGGGSCPGCPELGPCTSGEDCQTGVCQSGLCVPATATGEMVLREGWTARASELEDQGSLHEVFDGLPTRWASHATQSPGMWFEVDMNELRPFFAVELICQSLPTDCPVRFDIYVSNDGNYGALPARAGTFGGTISRVEFDSAQVARYIKVVLVETSGDDWTIDEINVYK